MNRTGVLHTERPPAGGPDAGGGTGTAPRVGAYEAPAVARAVRILFVLQQQGEGLGVSEIARQAGIGKGPCFAILKTLQARDAVAFDPVRKRYHLGAALVRLAAAVVRRRAPLDAAHRDLERLALEVRLTCFVSVPYTSDQWILGAAAVSGTRVRTAIQIGLPIHALSGGNGKALMAWRPRAEVEQVVRTLGLQPYTRRTITEVPAFLRALERTRRLGYAEAFGEYEDGVNVLAAPIFDGAGEVVMILKVLGTESQLPPRRAPEVGCRLRRSAARITRAIGGSYPPVPA
jgi:IclR family acetate operon transcriptional repressor